MTEQHTSGQNAVAALWPDSNRFSTAWGEKTAEGLAASLDTFYSAERDRLRAENEELSAAVNPLYEHLMTVLVDGEPEHSVLNRLTDAVGAALAAAKATT